MSDDAFPSGDDLATPLGTDFYFLDDLLTDDERSFRDQVRQTCHERIAPIANEYWNAGGIDDRMVRAYFDMGVAGVGIDGFGGKGFSPLADGMISLELARADGSLATFNAVHSALVMTSVNTLGSDEQRARWLPALAAGEIIGAMGLTEPRHGSDVVQLETLAERDGDSYVLNGAKRWIGLATVCDIVVVWARDDDGKVGGFVVEDAQNQSGWQAASVGEKISNRGVIQGHIMIENLRIPAENRLAESHSFSSTNKVLLRSRQSVAWEALGHAVAAYEGALTYAKRREQFGKPLASFQLIQDKLAAMVTEITALQLMCTRMSQLEAEGRCTMAHAAMAKLACGRGARRVCAMARDILGGNGILLDHHVGRHFADIEAVYTYEGSDTVQSLLVGRAVTGLSAFA